MPVFVGTVDPTEPTALPKKTVSIDTTRTGKLLCAGGACHMRTRMPCSRFIVSHVSLYMCYHVHASWHAPGLSALLSENRRFRRCSGKRGLSPPEVVATHAYHACSIVHIMSDVCAACHAAGAHTERARDKSRPGGRPGSSLLGGTGAHKGAFLCMRSFLHV